MVFELHVPETVTLLDHVGVGLCDGDRLLLPEDDPQPETEEDPIGEDESDDEEMAVALGDPVLELVAEGEGVALPEPVPVAVAVLDRVAVAHTLFVDVTQRDTVPEPLREGVARDE